MLENLDWTGPELISITDLFLQHKAPNTCMVWQTTPQIMSHQIVSFRNQGPEFVILFNNNGKQFIEIPQLLFTFDTSLMIS